MTPADSAKTQATRTDHSLALVDALTSSQRWVHAFNRGEVDECADTYTDDALLEAKPFGTFAGREAIRSFWMDLVANGARELNYERIQVVQLDENTVHVSAQWTMNIGGGFISLERWENRGGRWMLAEDRFEVLSSAVAVG
jgi:ketosteroid isomerase-like protein